MTPFERRPRLRWLVPAGVVLAVVAGAGIGTASVSADAGLAPRTAQELLVALQSPDAQAVSGVVEVRSDLGLPALPASMGGSTDGLTSLASGTHTLRVWADGTGKARVDLLAERGEYDVIGNGQDVWTWDSSTATADHYVLPSDAAAKAPSDQLSMPSTPAEAADLVLSSLEPTTEVTTSGAGSVAGRPVYELALTPRQPGTKVARVVVSIDAETTVPLRVQVFSTQTQAPAFDVGFTSVDFATPDASVFAFTPPPGAEVTEHSGADMGTGDTNGAAAAPRPTVVGTGWTRVLVAQMPTPSSDGTAGTGDAASMAAVLPAISGAWGTGRVLDGTLFSAILTDDGRIAIGAVTPDVLAGALAGA